MHLSILIIIFLNIIKHKKNQTIINLQDFLWFFRAFDRKNVYFNSHSIFHFFLALCFEDFFINFSNDFLLAMSWQIFAISLGAFLILMWLLQNNKANQTSSLFFLVPPTSALLAYLILNEEFILIDFLGLFWIPWVRH